MLVYFSCDICVSFLCVHFHFCFFDSSVLLAQSNVLNLQGSDARRDVGELSWGPQRNLCWRATASSIWIIAVVIGVDPLASQLMERMEPCKSAKLIHGIKLWLRVLRLHFWHSHHLLTIFHILGSEKVGCDQRITAWLLFVLIGYHHVNCHATCQNEWLVHLCTGMCFVSSVTGNLPSYSIPLAVFASCYVCLCVDIKDVIDIVNDTSPDSKEEEDPRLFRSAATGRGPLRDDWLKHVDPKSIMCAYKVICDLCTEWYPT